MYMHFIVFMMVTGGMTKLCGIGGWYNLTNSRSLMKEFMRNTKLIKRKWISEQILHSHAVVTIIIIVAVTVTARLEIV